MRNRSAKVMCLWATFGAGDAVCGQLLANRAPPASWLCQRSLTSEPWLFVQFKSSWPTALCLLARRARDIIWVAGARWRRTGQARRDVAPGRCRDRFGKGNDAERCHMPTATPAERVSWKATTTTVASSSSGAEPRQRNSQAEVGSKLAAATRSFSERRRHIPSVQSTSRSASLSK